MRPRRPSRPSRRAAQSGLTLVELLVSMLILGFVLTLVSEAVFQVAQVSRSAQAVTSKLSTHWSRGSAAASVIANLVAPPEAAEGEGFIGSASRLSGYTLQPPNGSDVGVRAFALELRRSTDKAAGSELVAIDGDAFGKADSESVIAYFDDQAEFAYVDAAGQVQPSWPPNTVAASPEPEDLPQAVLVRGRTSRQVLMWYGYQGEVFRSRPAFNPFGITR